jgi:hypothetical protein
MTAKMTAKIFLALVVLTCGKINFINPPFSTPAQEVSMKHLAVSPSRLLIVLLVAMALVAFVGCSKKEETPASPQSGMQELILSAVHPEFQRVAAIQDKHTPELMADPEVVGTATSLTADGKPAILILLKSELKKASMPASIEGVPTIVEVSGPIKAMKTTGVSHTARQTRRRDRPAGSHRCQLPGHSE